VNEKINNLAVEKAVESAFARDENLYSIHPKIYAKPSYRIREEEIENQK